MGFSGVLRYERVALPYAGGVYDQPARDMEALEVLEDTANVVLYEQAEERRSLDARHARAKAKAQR